MLPLILGAVARIAGSAILRGAASTAARSVATGAARSAATGAVERGAGSRVLSGMQFGSNFARGVHDGGSSPQRGGSDPAPLDPPQRSS